MCIAHIIERHLKILNKNTSKFLTIIKLMEFIRDKKQKGKKRF